MYGRSPHTSLPMQRQSFFCQGEETANILFVSLADCQIHSPGPSGAFSFQKRAMQFLPPCWQCVMPLWTGTKCRVPLRVLNLREKCFSIYLSEYIWIIYQQARSSVVRWVCVGGWRHILQKMVTNFYFIYNCPRFSTGGRHGSKSGVFLAHAVASV